MTRTTKQSLFNNEQKIESDKKTGEEKSEQDISNIDLDALEKASQEITLQEACPSAGASELDEDSTKIIIARLAHTMYLSPLMAFIAIALLFLKGAASKTAPDKMFVEVTAKDGDTVKIRKQDLMEALYKTTGNKFIRRLAESLATRICNFAEKHGLSGDLAFNFDIEEVSEGGTALSPKERAWSNSFCQHVPNLEVLASPRVKVLLGKDYQRRFNKKKTKAKGDRPPEKKGTKM